MIKLEHVNKYFYRHKKNEIHVINNTSIEIEDKGLVSLLGPSGCGKTTLLNAIGGLDKVSKGKIFINGKKISKRSSRKIDKIRNMNIGYIFQDYNLVNNMTVFDNVALSLRINGIKNKEEIKARVEYILEKVGMYKYRNRLASMLSGGERQRVGIARAIVKNPSIIIADEPTGNLDSRNTIEIMNIIKAISKDKLVILVTHERELAEFYSTRILEIEDGKIVNDRKNDHNNELDYKMDSKIYLKDFKNINNIKEKNLNINYYSNDNEKLNINIIVQNGNIYIENKSDKKVEVVNETNVEVIDDHYKKLSKEEAEKYEFDMNSVSNNKFKMRYSSILNIFTLLKEGFAKVRDYSFIKKLLLIGFFVSGAFILYSISSLFGINRIDDSKFVEINKNYLIIETEKIKKDNYLALEQDEDINYIIPTDSTLTMYVPVTDYYQTRQAYVSLKGSVSSLDMINESNIVYGRMPENDKEIVIDKQVFKKVSGDYETKNVGLFSAEDLLDKNLMLNKLTNYKIVGISDTNSPSIYVNNLQMINIIYYKDSDIYMEMENDIPEYELIDYNLVQDQIKIKKGRLPKNDYEVIVNYDYKDTYKLNKKISYKINKTKLKVVGYYKSNTVKDKYLVSNNTIKLSLIDNCSDISIYSKDKETTLNKYKDSYNIKDSYEYSKSQYLLEIKDTKSIVIKTSIVFLTISLIEIYLMIRSSFLSRIKEVGIYRAIGVKKIDIYKMFTGEIISITTLSSLPGILLMTYALYELSFINSVSTKFEIDLKVVLISIIVTYAFNLLVGLLPVYRTIKKTPAQILSRTDI